MKKVDIEDLVDFDLVFEEYNAVDSDDMTDKLLRMIDEQVRQYGLEVICWENGSALNWIIVEKSDTGWRK